MSEILQLRLLGRPEVSLDGVVVTESLAAKAQAILYYLAATDPSGQPRSVLAPLLWGDVSEGAARTNLRKALANLRQTLGEFLDLDGQTIAFKPGCLYWVDVKEFLAKMTASPAAAPQLQEAMTLYRGDFLAGFYVREAFDFENWMLAEQARLRELVIQALHALATQYAEQGEPAQGIGCVRRLLSLEPWREEAHRQLMQLLAQAGQRSAALAQYETCRQVLEEELGVEPGPETVVLYEQIKTGELSRAPKEHENGGENVTAAPLLPRSPAPLHNLPSQPTPFIGRATELADILRRLTDRDCRLLTLVGPGGIGKTRLALQTAQAFIASQPGEGFFSHGIIFVPLAAVGSTPGMVSAIAEAVNFSFYSNVPPRQQLLDYLREKEMLLILDDLEHLLAMGGTELIAGILTAAPKVKMLVTSREALNLQEAWFHPVEGMSFPVEEAQLSEAAPLKNYDAVQLFVQSAQRTRVSFSLTAERAHVVRICQVVEGMPLAIELAATWLKALPVEKIAGEIERGLDLLSTRLQNVPARHRSIRVIFEQSWQLLGAEERAVLKRLAVFRGSFDQAAAEQVAGATLISLAVLVEKSLLRVTAQGRYQLQELLRQFAGEKLRDTPDDEAAGRTAHSGYYLTLLKTREGILLSQGQPEALAELDEEIENIRLAWQWAVEQDQLEALARTGVALYHYYQIRNRYQEGEEIFAQTATHLQRSANLAGQAQFERVLTQALARWGALTYFLGEYELANKRLHESLAMARHLGASQEIAFILNLLGQMAGWQGKDAEARLLLQQSLALSREIGDDHNTADALERLAQFSLHLGEYDQGKRLAEESLAISRRLGRPDWMAKALDTLGLVTFFLGEYSQAERYYGDCLAISEKRGDQYSMALALGGLGLVAWAVGGAGAAKAIPYAEKGLALSRGIGHQLHIAGRLSILGLLANSVGDYAQAQQYGQEALAIARRLDSPIFACFGLCVLGQAAGGLSDFHTGRKYLVEALEITFRARLIPQVLDTLFDFADLLVKESSQAGISKPAPSQQAALALVQLVLVAHHPQAKQISKERANRLITHLETELPADVVAAAKAQGQSQLLDDMIETVLSNSARPVRLTGGQ